MKLFNLIEVTPTISQMWITTNNQNNSYLFIVSMDVHNKIFHLLLENMTMFMHTYKNTFEYFNERKYLKVIHL